MMMTREDIEQAATEAASLFLGAVSVGGGAIRSACEAQLLHFGKPNTGDTTEAVRHATRILHARGVIIRGGE